MESKIKNLSNALVASVKEANIQFIKRTNSDNTKQIFLKDLLLFSAKLNHSFSYANVNTEFRIDGTKKVTLQAFNKRRAGLDLTLIDKINYDLLKYAYPDTNKSRIIAVDCSQINLPYKLHKFGYKKSSSKQYCIAKISSLFDVEKKLPINYELDKTCAADGKILLKQLAYLRKGYVLIMDRGYYSTYLVKKLSDIGVNFIFRMKVSSQYVKNLKPTVNDKQILVKFGKQAIVGRIVRYTIGTEDYFLLTTLLNPKITVDILAKKYWDRWTCESDFRKVKYDVLFNGIRSVTDKQVCLDIKMVIFIGILTACIESFQDLSKKNKKINTKNTIDILVKKLLYLMLYKNKTKKMINMLTDIIDILYTVTTKIVKNRSCPRRRVSPSTKWNANGNRYGPG